MQKVSDREKSSRQKKVATLINAALVEVLRRGKMLDERLINCPVTITKVLVTADLKVADCYFLPFNTVFNKIQLTESLNNSKYAIRNFITAKINLKYSPEIRFHYDHGFDNADKVDKLLKQAETNRMS
ncbi:MAG TPA: 30S ribosome-binding factor RbfA [Rickettsia endosymbiont of Sericostoma sp.]|jgi:ribosome-binding factor A|uniref:30S ribosome-binding factor RbfA n=1 Tax=unclassified Candidatus Tisiphia TaxID=2996318 RepID=UPI001DE9E346|nr:30S ribosome-binding factor RbfA [Rickettsia endosymbiont of Sericostoma sp. HW-2014]HJD63561.1 30S ribosome-binding factor RbfA [Rickettsia endosymbiont of Sericostoma sp.]